MLRVGSLLVLSSEFVFLCFYMMCGYYILIKPSCHFLLSFVFSFLVFFRLFFESRLK